ncbi:MAG: Sua5/YciO/YrdC/YwlC family protein, partial [Bacteroidales bacterium]|nr:Sua5/YciO/YrdC/YwlC family protein [Bacteroidales bacterium]
PGALCSEGPGKDSRHLLAYNCVAEDGSVGIRIPQMDYCRDLIRKFGRPIVSTSANISGEPTPRCFAEISQEIIRGADFVSDSSLEKFSCGKPSSIIKINLDSTFKIIR